MSEKYFVPGEKYFVPGPIAVKPQVHLNNI